MSIKKQEFYEGAALHLLARTNTISSILYEAPFFRLNKSTLVLLKYCTKNRSPWGFTFTPQEQKVIDEVTASDRLILSLVCGSDGIVTIDRSNFRDIAAFRHIAIYISCSRDYGKHYEVSGPDGSLKRKISPSKWSKILQVQGEQ